jgi:hypothetical protein
MSRMNASSCTIALLLAAACNGEILPPDADHVAAEPGALAMAAPPRAGWEPVADALVVSCGTLDCHGQVGRNLRLYGGHGLRLAAGDDPGGRPTTAAEYQASYWSTIGLEPELLDQVVRASGADPERLMIMRKPRGLIKHKGGSLMQPNDALDQCLRLWLAGAPERTVCEESWPQRPGGAAPP